ncbi:MAG TPA: protein translocase subunit SecD [Terracidiphilus sp.]|nr:protein translocase subunit SecD [Terracidiphilus sp.]
MKKNLKKQIALIFAVLLVCLYGIFGVPSGLSGSDLLHSIQKRIHLGLDLQGGAHLILQVQVADAVNDETNNSVQDLEQAMKKANLTYSQIIKPDPKKPEVISIQGTSPAQSNAVSSLLNGSRYSNEYDVSQVNDTTWTMTMKPVYERDLDQRTVQQAISTITDRVNALGVTEPQIAPYGLGVNQILVELPGVSDMNEVKNMIKSTARLEIHAVEGDAQGYPSEQAALSSVGGTLPPDQEILPSEGELAGASGTYYILQRVAVVAGSEFRSATPGTNPQTGQRDVNFTLTDSAGDKFWDFTSANVGKYMAVVMGGTVREVASIKEPIRDSGLIEGSFSPAEVDALSKLLRSGSLPASLTYIQENTVGATLGADSIREGVTAAIVGMVLVWGFMLFYYKGSGVNADLALFLNLVILLAFMGFSKATLTLPGIAGVILTIGMGVDSNVLVFERIREEIRAGKAPAASVDQGFAHAWTTIFDTHVTTMVSAAFLFIFGTGPVRGFATTLVFGLAANLFTSVYVSRVIFEAHLNNLKPGEMVSI